MLKQIVNWQNLDHSAVVSKAQQRWFKAVGKDVTAQ
jgi:hypothetical protein